MREREADSRDFLNDGRQEQQKAGINLCKTCSSKPIECSRSYGAKSVSLNDRNKQGLNLVHFSTKSSLETKDVVPFFAYPRFLVPFLIYCLSDVNRDH